MPADDRVPWSIVVGRGADVLLLALLLYLVIAGLTS